MRGRFLLSAGAAGAVIVLGLAPTPSHAQSAGAVFGGLAGGVLGGVIAGSIAAQAARERPVVVYAAPRRTVRVIHEVRRVPAPRRKVVRANRQPMQPAAGPTGAQVVNASADPFASPRGNATTSVNQTR
ncbi:hypothetical protein LOK46_30045 (plasmid) [Methylobacterium sp. NMS14P]|uniref:hypothetical protein n=1 Tax=Methylobacterium sp. NMS14P TaxID=2894310 RepID=UPI00235A40E8|nr:hypothetical protein [Methylobacterium sp. NMS14P]WCS28638.1 hypothetical protein LOK46_30045 [Methylobacterium sp. NMS14P]